MESISDRDVGRRVRAARSLAVEQTQAELAYELEKVMGRPWTADQVAQLERGNKRVTLDILHAVAEAQGQPVDFYLGKGTVNFNRVKPGSLVLTSAQLLAVG